MAALHPGRWGGSWNVWQGGAHPQLELLLWLEGGDAPHLGDYQVGADSHQISMKERVYSVQKTVTLIKQNLDQVRYPTH